jgi:hypothetical protein
MAKTKITDVDKGWKKHGRAVKRGRRNPHVIVGILPKDASKQYEKGKATTIDVGVAHEFGTDHLPERSFIRAPHDTNAREYQKILDKFQKPVLLGTISARAALTILGLKVQSNIHKHMTAGIPPDKKDGKKARLIQTKQLFNSIELEVNA